MLIRDILQRDLSKRIEEIIKVDQTDDRVVYDELNEYVVTDAIRDHYRNVFSAIAEAPKALREDTGIWVSGFFGSGKSSFAKNLGYVLENRKVGGELAADVFKRRVNHPPIANLIDSIHTMFPVKVIMFDVQTDRSLGPERRSIAHYMYKVLLRELDYADDFEVAELEITLEFDGKLDDFRQRFENRFGGPWSTRRKLALRMGEASAILSEMDPATFPEPDSWSKGRAGQVIEATPNLLVDRSYELMARRYPGHALVYIIDEVGQFIARSSDRIEDIRRTVELLGAEGRNRVTGGKAVSPAWLVATSQERLDEVVSSIGDVRVQLAKVRDRFSISVDLSAADIREIVVKRVLEKKPEHIPALKELYANGQGSLKTHAGLERTRRTQEFEPDSFAEFHPYLPHHIDTLSIDIVSGIRLQPGADRTIGGATRTIIKQAYEMLVNDRTKLADEPVGTLVTLDRLYELLESSLSTEIRRDISDVDSKFAENPWCKKVIRAVALLSFVRDLPRTAHNIAALLYPRIDAPSPLKDVEEAVRQLVEAQHLRDSEDGYKILTAQEKSWQSEKDLLAVAPRQREERVNNLLDDIFDEPNFKTYRYKSRSFSINAMLQRNGGEKPGITIEVIRADSQDTLESEVEQARVVSRTSDRVYWVFPLTSELDSLVAELVRSSEMIRQYDQIRSQNKINAEESASLDEEKRQANSAEIRLRGKLQDALATGRLLSKGVSKDVNALGSTSSEALKNFLGDIVPGLYPMLDDAAVELGATDIENLLKAANLDALPKVFGVEQLKMFVKTDGTVKFQQDAPASRHVLGYMKSRVDYGDKPSGSSLESNFTSSPFGWEPDVLRAVLAGLHRGGAIRVTTGGKTYDDYTDEQAWPAFIRITNFRSATFAPQSIIGAADLVKARENYVALTGTSVDVDQQQISRALGDFLRDELSDLPGLIAESKAKSLPVTKALEGYQQEIVAIEREDTQKRIAYLAEEGSALKGRRDEVNRLRSLMTSDNIGALSQAQSVLDNVWPVLRESISDKCKDDAAELEVLLASPDLFDHLSQIESKSGAIHQTFKDVLEESHSNRNASYGEALERASEDGRLPQVNSEDKTALLHPLSSRVCNDYSLEVGDITCNSCGSSPQMIESDVAAVGGYESSVYLGLAKLMAPSSKPTKVIKARQYFHSVETPEDVDQGIASLKDELLKSLDEGNTTIVE
jgi:hypothetical protein